MQKNKYMENKTLKNQLQFFCNDSMQHVPQVTWKYTIWLRCKIDCIYFFPLIDYFSIFSISEQVISLTTILQNRWSMHTLSLR